jgi:hypothetical protein
MNETEKFNILRTATNLTFPRWGAWLYDTWKSHNETYFDGQLKVIPLYFGILPHGAKLGLYHSGDYPRISIHQSLLDPSGDAWQILPLLGERFASDVLLHEMVHQAIYERYGHDGSELDKFSGASSHNNPAWCAEIVRLASMIGLGSIKAQPVRRTRLDNAQTGKKGKPSWQPAPGYLDREQLSSFPHCLTNEAYYRNESTSRL